MRILILGAGGMLGQAVAGCSEARGHQTIARNRAQLDITATEAVAGVLRTERRNKMNAGCACVRGPRLLS